jgi:hypothetical protein
MAASGSKFDWSSLDRDGLAAYLWLLAPEIVNKRTPIDQFHKLISKHLKNYLPLRVAKQFDPIKTTNAILIGGCYYSDKDKNHQRSIELLIVYNPIDDSLKINKRRFLRICYGIADTILHEIIHMRQFRRREFKYLPEYDSTANRTEQRLEQVYLGCSDEIDAYGFNIACELSNTFGGNQAQIIKYLDTNQRGIRRQFNSWKMYLKAFNHDHDHVIIKRLKKKILRYLPYAEIGKPYRNKDWISH